MTHVYIMLSLCIFWDSQLRGAQSRLVLWMVGHRWADGSHVTRYPRFYGTRAISWRWLRVLHTLTSLDWTEIRYIWSRYPIHLHHAFYNLVYSYFRTVRFITHVLDLLYSWTPHSMGQVLGWTVQEGADGTLARVVVSEVFLFLFVFIRYGCIIGYSVVLLFIWLGCNNFVFVVFVYLS